MIESGAGIQSRTGAHRHELVLVGGLLAGLTVLMTWPQTLLLSTHVNDHGDPLLNVWALAWVAHQLPRDPLQLFDANIFYPERATLAHSESLVLPAVAVAPLRWIGVSPVVTYNLVMLAAFPLSGLAMFALIRRLTGSVGAGLVAAASFAFLPYRFDQAGARRRSRAAGARRVGLFSARPAAGASQSARSVTLAGHTPAHCGSGAAAGRRGYAPDVLLHLALAAPGHGFSGFFPESHTRLKAALVHFPDDASMEAVRERGIELIVLHERYMPRPEYRRMTGELDRRSDVTPVATFGPPASEQRVYAVSPRAVPAPSAVSARPGM
jgi:hypothetical protein